ncbi:MAG: glycosyltransferase family 4 protein [Pseudomonadota bacterium]
MTMLRSVAKDDHHAAEMRPGAVDPSAVPAIDRVVIINDFSVVRGGATQIAMSEAAALSARGINVTYIAGDDATSIKDRHDGVTYLGIGSDTIMQANRGKAFVSGLANLRSARFLHDFIATHDTPGTIYHLHGWSKVLSPIILRPLRRVSNRLVVHAHDFFLVCPNGGYTDFRASKICSRRPMSAACIVANCDRRSMAHKAWRVARGVVLSVFQEFSNCVVVPVHEEMTPHLVYGGIPGGSVKALRNPVTAWTSTRIEAENNRRFVFVGRLDADKGADLACEAAARSGVELLVIGMGPLFEDLKQRYPNFEFVGWCDRHQLREKIQDCRALIMPSRMREPFGIVAVEAISSGLPIIASDRAMLAGDIVRGGFGVVCDPEDQTALTAHISEFANEDGQIEKMSRNGFTHGYNLAPTPDGWTDQLIALFHSRLEN